MVKAGPKALAGMVKKAGAARSPGNIGILKEGNKLINLQLSVLGKHLVGIAKVMTKFKITMLSAIAGIVKALPDMLKKAMVGFIDAFKSMFEVTVKQSAQMKVNFNDMLVNTQKMVALLTTGGGRKRGGKTPRTTGSTPESDFNLTPSGYISSPGFGIGTVGA